ncbi:MAG TPA: EAL domain-containing protein [Candidatus Limnocylindria bacterium]|nr:EAL domain-containing protein [Candidatus Limnocylindria bacterium]
MGSEDRPFDVGRAITANELVLYYQPRVLVETRVMRGVEALLRWRHPSRGILAPTEFLDRAEGGAAMRDLEAWVIREAVRQAGVWRADGLRAGVSVNMSPGLLRDAAFLRLFERTLKIQGDPTTLTIEIAAPSLQDDRPREALDRLRSHGCRLALDDVTDVAQLDAAAWTAWDYVKLGRAVVAPARTDAVAAKRLRAITDRTSALGVRTVGMGVEDDATLDLLRQLGVFLAQGYAIAPPLEVREVTEWAAGRGRPA